MRNFCTRYLLVVFAILIGSTIQAEVPTVFDGRLPDDHRLGELKTLNGFFPFKAMSSRAAWKQRQIAIKRRILISQGLWPLPTRTPLNAVIHGRVEREDYVVDRVFFESIPGHYVTGSLYRPKEVKGPFPVILSPHGHWQDGRFYEAGEAVIGKQLETGAERFKRGGRFPLQARAVQLARMGCMVFHYDMTGYADAVQVAHRPDRWEHLDRSDNWGFMSVQAELRLQNMMGLQTWNSIRAVDFVMQLEEVDPSRVGVTGASGGGTQAMILGAIDERIAASMPCVMVSTGMQGGCTCENAPLLRIDQGNIDIAAATAPRPLGLTAADDWTINLKTSGFPDLQNIYQMLGVPERLTGVFHTQFPHNYNQLNRAAMYAFFNQHFSLGHEVIAERDFLPLSQSEATVWSGTYPRPSGDQVGDLHETRLLGLASQDSDRKISALVPDSSAGLPSYRKTIGAAWETLIGRRDDQVGKVVYQQTSSNETSHPIIQAGMIRNVDHQEEFPVLKFLPRRNTEKKGSVIWVADEGKVKAFENDKVAAEVLLLVNAGYDVIVPDLFGQGELATTVVKDHSQRLWFQRDGSKGWHKFSGYTYGFNHSLFVQRTHDLLSVIEHVKEKDEVCVIGLGEVAGPLVAAACSQAGKSVQRCVVEMQGFRFASIDRHEHPMFVPGAVKYLDLDGLMSLVAPVSLTISGEDYPITRKVYAACGASSQLRFTDAGIGGARLLAELQLGD